MSDDENQSISEVDALLSLNLKNMNKTELLKKAMELQSYIKGNPVNDENYTNTSKSESILICDIIKRLEKIEKENKYLKKEVNDLYNYADECDDKIYSLEKQVNQIDQYIRRENITISGLPDNLPTEILEENVIKVLDSINVSVSSKDIVACHRLEKTKKEKAKDDPSKVIVRFMNRKNVVSCLKNKKKLSETRETLGYPKNLYINEHLCPSNQQILEDCLSYKYNKKISSCWTYNGIVNIKFSKDKTERPKKIFTTDELYDAVNNRYIPFL